MGFILTSNLSTADQQKLADYGLDRSRVMLISTIAFLGAATLGILVAQPFRISRRDFLIQLIREEISELEIAEGDKDILAKSIWDLVEDLRELEPCVFKEKLAELFHQLEDPSADNQVALQQFQAAVRGATSATDHKAASRSEEQSNDLS